MPNKKEVFIELYVENQSTIYSYILTLVYDVDVAHDILQETAVFLWEEFESFQTGGSFSNWAVTIARYKVLEYFRQKKRNHPLLTEEQLRYICDRIDQHVHEAERFDILQKCIDRLTRNDRLLLAKRYEEGMPVKQIALNIGRPVQGLYKAMARIFYTLQRCVKTTVRSMESGL